MKSVWVQLLSIEEFAPPTGTELLQSHDMGDWGCVGCLLSTMGMCKTYMEVNA